MAKKSDRWQDGQVSGRKGVGAYFSNCSHPTFFDWNNTPYSCRCGFSVAKVQGPPKGRGR